MQRPWLSFDCEATGVDPETDLVVSVALMWLDPTTPGSAASVHELLDWDVDIPEAATKVHGLTREILAARGRPPAEVLEETVKSLVEQMTVEVGPVVGMNLSYDLTILDRCCRRAGVTPLIDRCEINPVLDAFVLDKYVDPFRKGKRNLEALATHYRVPWVGDAHNALADARVAAGVVWRIGRMYPALGAVDPVLLHDLQARAKQEQDKSFRKYLLENNRDATGVDGVWPYRPYGGGS